MKKLFLISVLMLAALVACNKPGETEKPGGDTTAASVTLTSESAVAVPVEGDIVTIKFKATADWTAASDKDWLTLTPDHGTAGEECTVKAAASKNETNDIRSATVTITCGTAKATVAISQRQADVLRIKTTRYEVPAEGGTVEVELETNLEYTVTIPEAIDWVHQADVKALTEYKVNLIVDASTETEQRQAVIGISAGNDLSGSITITQAAFEAYFEFGGDVVSDQYGGRLLAPQEGGSVTIPVATNLEWRVHFDEDWPPEDTSWISFEQEDEAIVVTVTENDTYLARSEWIYVSTPDEAYGGYFEVYQPGLEAPCTPELEWTVAFPEQINKGYNRLAYANSGALLVSDGTTNLHAINPADGSYLQTVQLGTIVAMSIDSDDAGNIIVADDLTAVQNTTTWVMESGAEMTVYSAQNLNEEMKVIKLSNGIGGTIGGLRARGDLATKGTITGFAGGASYWFGYDIENFAAVANDFGAQHSGPNAGPDAIGFPEHAACVSYGDNLEDGVLLRGYDGDAGGQRVHYRNDAYTPLWYANQNNLEYEAWTEVTTAGAGGNEDQNNMDVIDYDGKKILAFTQGYHFNWGFPNADIYILDITDVEEPEVLAVISTEDWIEAEAVSDPAQIGADVLLRAGDDCLELYAIQSTLATIAKFTLTF